MGRRIRVLHVISDGTIGGGQRHLLYLVEGLDKNVFDAQVACGDNGPLVADLRARGISVHSVKMRPRLSPMPILHLSRLLRSENIDIVHLHGGIAGFWGRLSGAWAGTSVRVYTIHGIHYLHYPNRLKRATFIALERVLSRSTDKVICVAEADRNSGLKQKLFSPDQVVVIKNGIPLPSLDEPVDRDAKKKEIGIPTDAPVIGTVGRLHRQKGQRFLLDAAPEILREVPNVQFLLVGDGPLRRELEAHVQKIGLNGVVHFLGPRRDVSELITLFDVFVLPSLWEGLPLSVLEALAAGRPVVATAVDGIPEIIDHEQSGLLVPPANAEALGKAIVRLLSDRAYAQELGLQGRRRVSEAFNVKRMVQETASLYMRLINRN